MWFQYKFIGCDIKTSIPAESGDLGEGVGDGHQPHSRIDVV